MAIQAAQKIPGNAKDSYLQKPSVRAALEKHFNIRRKDELCMLPTGSLLCVANLVDCIKITTDNPRELPIPDKFKTDGWEEFGDYSRGRYLWLLDDIQALTVPIPCRGYQGLWNLGADIISQLQAQLTPTKAGISVKPETAVGKPVESASAYEKAVQEAPPFERSLLTGKWMAGDEVAQPSTAEQIKFIQRTMAQGTTVESRPVEDKEAPTE